MFDTVGLALSSTFVVDCKVQRISIEQLSFGDARRFCGKRWYNVQASVIRICIRLVVCSPIEGVSPKATHFNFIRPVVRIDAIGKVIFEDYAVIRVVDSVPPGPDDPGANSEANDGKPDEEELIPYLANVTRLKPWLMILPDQASALELALLGRACQFCGNARQLIAKSRERAALRERAYDVAIECRDWGRVGIEPVSDGVPKGSLISTTDSRTPFPFSVTVRLPAIAKYLGPMSKENSDG